jgi:hypothetical protein
MPANLAICLSLFPRRVEASFARREPPFHGVWHVSIGRLRAASAGRKVLFMCASHDLAVISLPPTLLVALGLCLWLTLLVLVLAICRTSAGR